MRPEFTDDELKAAHKIAAKQIRIEEMFTTKYLSAFLDALPDRHEEWQECDFSEIRKGDRLRAVSPNGDLSEFTVQTVDRLLAHGEYDEVSHTKTATYYRIPAPVVHPDPDEHPVIARVEYYDENDPEYAAVGHADREIYQLFNNGVFEATVHPTEILNWTPAKVIADE